MFKYWRRHAGPVRFCMQFGKKVGKREKHLRKAGRQRQRLLLTCVAKFRRAMVGVCVVGALATSSFP